MAALAICAVTAALLRDRTDTQAPPPVRPGQEPPADPGMIPLTVPEVKRILAARAARPWPPGHVEHWDAGPAPTRLAHDGSTSASDSPETLKSPWSASKVRLPYWALLLIHRALFKTPYDREEEKTPGGIECIS